MEGFSRRVECSLAKLSLLSTSLTALELPGKRGLSGYWSQCQLTMLVSRLGRQLRAYPTRSPSVTMSLTGRHQANDRVPNPSVQRLTGDFRPKRVLPGAIDAQAGGGPCTVRGSAVVRGADLSTAVVSVWAGVDPLLTQNRSGPLSEFPPTCSGPEPPSVTPVEQFPIESRA
jgi:hypothetical protein